MSYCSACDTRQIFRSLDNRPISRATCWHWCRNCLKKVPSCRSCAQTPGCRLCGERTALVSFDAQGHLDSDDETRGDNESDVRSDPPRFTPVCRGHDVLPSIWILKKGWWFPSDADISHRYVDDIVHVAHWCTGCDRPAGIRWLVKLVMVIDGRTQRYQHKLCSACAVCVMNRPVSIQAATLFEGVTYLHIEFGSFPAITMLPKPMRFRLPLIGRIVPPLVWPSTA